MSFSLDYNAMLTTAQGLIEGLWGVFLIPIGFGLAFAILGMLYNKITGSIKGL